VIARAITVIARTTPINASLSDLAMCSPPGNGPQVAMADLRRRIGERCVNYFTLTRLCRRLLHCCYTYSCDVRHCILPLFSLRFSIQRYRSGFRMGEPTLDRRFHRKLETEGLTLKKVLLLVVLSLGVACAVGVVDQL
jgi:hypothetical protein